MDFIDVSHPLIPILDCAIRHIEGGHSVRTAIDAILRSPKVSWPLKRSMGRSFHEFENAMLENLKGGPHLHLKDTCKRPARESLGQTHYLTRFLLIIELGVQGHSIAAHLKSLRTEVELQLDWDLKSHLDGLPQKATLPIVCCALPSYLIIALLPVLKLLLRTICLAAILGLPGLTSFALASDGADYKLKYADRVRIHFACEEEMRQNAAVPIHCWIQYDSLPSNCRQLIQKSRHLPELKRAERAWLQQRSESCAAAISHRREEMAYRRTP